MKAFNAKIEIRLIKTILDGSIENRSKILSFISNDHFGYTPANEVFNRLTALMTKAKDIPKSRTLKHDPILDDEAKNIISTKLKSLSSNEIDSALDTIERYRKARVQTKGIERALTAIERLKTDKAETILENTLLKSHSASTGDIIHNEGIVSIAEKMLKEKYPKKYKTGIEAFDSKSGGFPKEGVVILSAPPKSFKSALALHIATTQYLQFEYEPCYVSMEMPNEEIVERQMASLAGVNYDKIQLRILNKKDKRKIKKACRMFADYEKITGKKFSLYSPEDDVTFFQLMNRLTPFKHNIIYVDYISLLYNKKELPDWQFLRETTRLAKRFARKLKSTIVLLAQLGDEGQLRYSKGILENCITGDALINTTRGLIEFKDIIKPKNTGISHRVRCNVNSIKKQTEVFRWYNRGKKQTYKINTERGFELKGTKEHKILCLNSNLEYTDRKIEDIKNGDFIAIKRKDYIWPKERVELFFDKRSVDKGSHFSRTPKIPRVMDKNLARVLGYLASEGYIGINGNNYVISFVNKDKRLIKDYEKCFYKCFGYKPDKGKNKNNVIECRTVNKELYYFLKYLDSSGNSRTKKISWTILQSPKNIVKEFLKCYFEGDGSVGKIISVVSYSERLSFQVHKLLLQFGIISSLNNRFDNYKKRRGTKKSKHWDIIISGNDSNIFRKQIGCITKNKKYNSLYSPTYDFIPYLSKKLHSFKYAKNGYITEKGDKIIEKFKYGFSKEITYNKLIKNKKLLLKLKQYYPSLYKKLKIIMKDNFYWELVTYKRKDRKEKVYDFSTRSHYYIANGMVVHNCDLWWRWMVSEGDKQAGFMTIDQGAARSMPIYPFNYGINPKKMSFFEYEGNEDPASNTDKKTENKARKKYKKFESEIEMNDEEF